VQTTGESGANFRGSSCSALSYNWSFAKCGLALCPRPPTFSRHNFPWNPHASACAAGVVLQHTGGECSFIDNRLKESCCRRHDRASWAHHELHPRTTTQRASTLRWVNGDASCRSRPSSRTVVPVFRQPAFAAWHMLDCGANRRVAPSSACDWQGSEPRRLHLESCLEVSRVVDVHCTTA
jgi:hypothetical protein